MAHSFSLHFCGALGIQSFQDLDVFGFHTLVLLSSKDAGVFNGIKCFAVVYEGLVDGLDVVCCAESSSESCLFIGLLFIYFFG
jgi:hypothetical protein